MAVLYLPDDFSSDFVDIIPAQREMVNNLLNMGVITSYSLSGSRRTLWVIITADTEDEARIIADAFPIRPFVTYDIEDLLFSANAIIEIPNNSLN